MIQSGHEASAERIAAGLRKVAPRPDAEARAERLQQDRHQVGEERDGQQREPNLEPPASEVAQLPGSM